MKKKSLLGALALSAALAIGTAVPAFAAGTNDAVTSTDAGAQTDVKIATYTASDEEIDENTQVSVTVPLSMTVVARTAGGDLITPAYRVINGSNFAVNVKGSYSLDSSLFNLALTDDNAAVGVGASAPTGFDGALKMVLTPSTGSDAWTIGKAAPTWAIDTNSTLQVAVTGATSQLGKAFDDASGAPTVLVFTYTVEKADTSTPEAGA